MRYPQVIIYETDGKLAAWLKREEAERTWSLREARSLEGCLRLLQRAGPSVLLLKVGKDLLGEMTLLDQVRQRDPESAVVVIGDTDNASLAGLAWDLGATFAFFPPIPRPELLGLIRALIAALSPGEPVAVIEDAAGEATP